MPRKKRYYEKNRHFQVWVPESLDAFFVDYLQHFCQGDSNSARFRIFLYELKSLQDRGITLVNPIRDYEAEHQKQLRESYGTTEADNICFRLPNEYPKWDAKTKAIQCQYCKDSKKMEYKPCQEERAELRKKSLGFNP